jgi:hypothetical protein
MGKATVDLSSHWFTVSQNEPTEKRRFCWSRKAGKKHKGVVGREPMHKRERSSEWHI